MKRTTLSVAVLTLTIVLFWAWHLRGVISLDIDENASSKLIEETHAELQVSEPDSLSHVEQEVQPYSPIVDEQRAFRSNDVNPAFLDVTAFEEQRYEPLVNAKFYPRGRPDKYRRHRLVKIDVGTFKKTLEGGNVAGIDYSESARVPVPLFDDDILDFVVTDWHSTDGGFISAGGHLAGQPTPESTLWVHFDHLGTMEIVVRQHEGTFIVEPLGEDGIYVVQSVAPSPDGRDFE